jgi:hypothetical protein
MLINTPLCGADVGGIVVVLIGTLA